MWSGAPYPQSCVYINVAMSYFIHSNPFTFTFAEYKQLQKVVDIYKMNSEDYKPPNINIIVGELPVTLYDVNWEHAMKYLLTD